MKGFDEEDFFTHPACHRGHDRARVSGRHPSLARQLIQQTSHSAQVTLSARHPPPLRRRSRRFVHGWDSQADRQTACAQPTSAKEKTLPEAETN